MADSLFPVRLTLNGAARTTVKGRGSLAAALRGLKRTNLGALGAVVPYPQKLWTTLWTDPHAGVRIAGQIA